MWQKNLLSDADGKYGKIYVADQQNLLTKNSILSTILSYYLK